MFVLVHITSYGHKYRTFKTFPYAQYGAIDEILHHLGCGAVNQKNKKEVLTLITNDKFQQAIDLYSKLTEQKFLIIEATENNYPVITGFGCIETAKKMLKQS